ncbi:MAG: POTRA domain-containing protein [Synergistaceae bacterium]|nr:POTRA domain-containing protein [Synergistaceae bacterium]
MKKVCQYLFCVSLVFVLMLGAFSVSYAEEIMAQGQEEPKNEQKTGQKEERKVEQDIEQSSKNTVSTIEQSKVDKDASKSVSTSEQPNSINSTEISPKAPNILKDTYKRKASSATTIVEFDVSGNDQVTKEHILSVCTSKIGEEIDEEKLRKDAEAIFELGFFGMTDYEVVDVDGGLKVTFVVTENPKIEEIDFEGNTVYKTDELRSILFTQPGMIFNRTFFRNDIQRIKEKYQNDGYSMTTVKDVRIEGEKITIIIAEPVVSQVIVQGNKYTKRYVIDRYLKVKSGEVFNANKLRQSITRLQALGYFSDVNVSFDSGDTPDEMLVIITVEEARTGKLGFNVSYGTQSGFGGGITYENSNIGGNGMRLVVGFEIGRRSNYWASYEQPYMSGKVLSWKVGAYRRMWNDVYYYYNSKRILEYDRDKYGVYFGFGKLFKDESRYSWYALLDWHNTRNSNMKVDSNWTDYARDKSDLIKKAGLNPAKQSDVVDFISARELRDGNYYSLTLSARRNGLSEYVVYPKGDVESVHLQVGYASITGSSNTYLKYWFDGRVYFPLNKIFSGIIDSELFDGFDGVPLSLAARAIIGSSTGTVPYDEMYEVGGDTTLRGYDNDFLHGEQMFLGNIELRLPVAKMVTLVGFYDIGGAWGGNSGCLDGSFLSNMQSAPGVGIRLNTPMGNMRLDYANGDEGRFHFGFGDMF